MGIHTKVTGTSSHGGVRNKQVEAVPKPSVIRTSVNKQPTGTDGFLGGIRKAKVIRTTGGGG